MFGIELSNTVVVIEDTAEKLKDTLDKMLEAGMITGVNKIYSCKVSVRSTRLRWVAEVVEAK